MRRGEEEDDKEKREGEWKGKTFRRRTMER